MDAPSERTLEKTSDFCTYMSAVISMMSQLRDCDKDLLREEIDTPVSLAWEKGADAVTQALYEAAGIKHRISLERIQAEVDFYFNTKTNEAPADNGHAEVKDPTQALSALIGILTAECTIKVKEAVPGAVAEAGQNLSKSVDELVVDLRAALADAIVPSDEELKTALLRAIPELAMNPPTPPEDVE